MCDFIEQSSYYKQYRPDIIILQIGIVDCGPRAFSKVEEILFCSNRLFYSIRRFLSKTNISRKIRNFRRLSWTPLQAYKEGFEFLISKFPDSIVYALSIIPTSEEYESQVPGISKKIFEYNSILQEVFGDNLINLSEIPNEGIMSDHHHLTKVGHQYVYEEIIKKIGPDS